MLSIILNILLKLLTSEATKTLIGIGVNKLLEHSKDGITSDIAKVMINGIIESKANPTSKDVFESALKDLINK